MMEYKDEDIYDFPCVVFSKGKLKVVYVTVGKGSLLEARLELIDAISRLKYDLYKATSPFIFWLIMKLAGIIGLISRIIGKST